MRRIEEVLLLDNREEIQKEIEERKDLVNQMIGTLYKGIVSEEIYILQNKLETVK